MSQETTVGTLKLDVVYSISCCVCMEWTRSYNACFTSSEEDFDMLVTFDISTYQPSLTQLRYAGAFPTVAPPRKESCITYSADFIRKAQPGHWLNGEIENIDATSLGTVLGTIDSLWLSITLSRRPRRISAHATVRLSEQVASACIRLSSLATDSQDVFLKAHRSFVTQYGSYHLFGREPSGLYVTLAKFRWKALNITVDHVLEDAGVFESGVCLNGLLHDYNVLNNKPVDSSNKKSNRTIVSRQVCSPSDLSLSMHVHLNPEVIQEMQDQLHVVDPDQLDWFTQSVASHPLIHIARLSGAAAGCLYHPSAIEPSVLTRDRHLTPFCPHDLNELAVVAEEPLCPFCTNHTLSVESLCASSEHYTDFTQPFSVKFFVAMYNLRVSLLPFELTEILGVVFDLLPKPNEIKSHASDTKQMVQLRGVTVVRVFDRLNARQEIFMIALAELGAKLVETLPYLMHQQNASTLPQQETVFTTLLSENWHLSSINHVSASAMLVRIYRALVGNPYLDPEQSLHSFVTGAEFAEMEDSQKQCVIMLAFFVRPLLLLYTPLVYCSTYKCRDVSANIQHFVDGSTCIGQKRKADEIDPLRVFHPVIRQRHAAYAAVTEYFTSQLHNNQQHTTTVCALHGHSCFASTKLAHVCLVQKEELFSTIHPFQPCAPKPKMC
jgi:hypothetical protein